MIRIQVIKASRLLYLFAIGLLCLLILGLGIGYFVNRSAQGAADTTQRPAPTAQAEESPDPTLDVGLDAPADKPLLRRRQETAQMVSGLARLLVDADPLDPMSVLKYEFPFLEEEAAAANAEADEFLPDMPDEPERIRVEIQRIEGEYEPPAEADKPRVLIYHTHSYEAYAQDPNDPYEETGKWRSADKRYNIMGVGEVLAENLRSLGFEVVHDLTEHEPPKLGTAYERSLKTLEGYAERGESFDLMIDLHRDAVSANNKNPSYILVDGKECARLMMLIGTGERGFQVKPNWQENYKLAKALTQELNAIQDGLCRDVMVKTGRYNQHMSTTCILIEVGHNDNTLAQAKNAMEPLAAAIQTLLESQESE